MNETQSTLNNEPADPRAMEQAVRILYLNYLGVLGWRTVIPIAGSLSPNKDNPYHEVGDWVFDAWDLGKRAMRTFSLSRIKFCTSLQKSLSAADEDKLYRETLAKIKESNHAGQNDSSHRNG